MDEKPFQFTLRNLLVEVTLIAAILGLFRVALMRYDDANDPRIIFSMIAAASLPTMCGAVVGGLTGEYARGAVWGTVIAGILLVLGLLFLPAVQS